MAAIPQSKPAIFAGTSLTKIFGPVTTGHVAQVKEMIFCNTDTTDRQLGVYRRDAGDTDWQLRQYVASRVLAAGNTEVWHLDLMLAADEEIYVKSDAGSKVACHISAIDHELAV